MPCYHVNLPGGGNAIVRMARHRPKPCAFCGAPSEVLCDYPSPDPIKRAKAVARGETATCDKPCCRKCSTHVGEDRDFCLEHSC
jgi:hypothetical protein